MIKNQPKSTNLKIPQEYVESKILLVRGKRVMLDRDLAQLYGVKTEQLTRQVRRNIDRFPDNFLLQLTKEEFSSLICHFGRSNWGGTRKPPFAFTEHGILMLSCVLNSNRAIQINIQIMETFIKLREMLANNKNLKQKIEQLEQKYDYQFKVVFDAIKRLINPPKKRSNRLSSININKKEKTDVIKNN